LSAVKDIVHLRAVLPTLGKSIAAAATSFASPSDGKQTEQAAVEKLLGNLVSFG